MLRHLTSAILIACAMALSLPSSASGWDEEQPFRLGTTRLPVEGAMPSLSGAIEWVNSPPLTAAQLRDKVVVIEFWTYTCINWRRTLPYVRAWADKYKDQGLIVIGVHTPEFEFERDMGNVRRATRELGINFPVAVDSKAKIWSDFGNQYWPALYFIDGQGRIRHHQFGEGDYDQSEAAIQLLLAEEGHSGFDGGSVSVHPVGPEVAADWETLRSPETYLGYGRSTTFVADRVPPGKPHVYTEPARLRVNEWALGGNWTVGPDSATANQANGRLSFRFHARDVNLILAPPSSQRVVRFRVLVDGAPPGSSHGSDVDDQGNGTVTEPRMYQLLRQSVPIEDRQVEIQFLDPGVTAFDFTFG
jgi:thiol-disulfide isomerase/thioredoxin